MVGTEILPGTYRTRQGSDGCYWARLSGFGGSSRDIVANDNTNGPAVVVIADTDSGFESRRCGTWTRDLSPITKEPTAPFVGEGTYIVGVDIAPGTWRSEGGTTCYWARLRGFGGTTRDIIANANPGTSAIVTVGTGDVGFKSSRCGTWTLVQTSVAPPPPQATTVLPTATVANATQKESAYREFAVEQMRRRFGATDLDKDAQELAIRSWFDRPSGDVELQIDRSFETAENQLAAVLQAYREYRDVPTRFAEAHKLYVQSVQASMEAARSHRLGFANRNVDIFAQGNSRRAEADTSLRAATLAMQAN